MGRPRKKAHDLTTEEAVKKLFPPQVVREAKKTAETKGKEPHGKDST
jgi:hypothetical protein